MAKIAVLDVGHANCAVLLDSNKTAVIDAGLQDTLLLYLERNGINTIDDILISHSDADHIAALPPLLLDPSIKIGRIFVNSDPVKSSATWNEFRRALRHARLTKSIEVHASLTTTDNGRFKYPLTEIEILGPFPEMMIGGVGGSDLQGGTQSAHSLNVVVRILAGTRGLVLLAGDMDQAALNELSSAQNSANAKVLVFPHHGGHFGATDFVAFVGALCSLVHPEFVVFSIGRGKHNTPRPEIVSAVRQSLPTAHIACTELSTHCAATLPTLAPSHLAEEPARGKANNSCCIGTIVFNIGTSTDTLLPIIADHDAFIAAEAPSALCKL